MITPHFEVTQDSDFVEVRIKVPHLRMEDGEFYVDGHEFKFHLRPYFLRLTFKQELTEDGRETATHDASAGILTVRVPKATPGEHFEDLGMLSELLRKPDRATARSGGPLIEVLSSTEHASGEDGMDDEQHGDAEAMDDAAIEAEAEVEQALPTTDELLGRVRYGFNDAYSGVFVGLEAEEVLQLREPERANPRERREARLQAEDDAFDADHYIADLMDDEAVQAALRYQPWWFAADPAAAAAAASADASMSSEGGAAAAVVAAAEAATAAGPSSSADDATRWLPIGSEEQQQLLQLPRKEYLMGGASAERRALCGLLDLLFAYCYDVRATEGDPTVESGWTVRSLSSLLSYLDQHEGVAEAATACVRRALCRPLLRHWRLALAVLADVARLLSLGRGAVLAALLRCRSLLQRHLDLGYLLNRVWLDDYCVWVQQLPAPKLAQLGAEVGALRLPKEAVGWPLDEYEQLAREDAEEMEEEEEQQGGGTLV